MWQGLGIHFTVVHLSPEEGHTTQCAKLRFETNEHPMSPFNSREIYLVECHEEWLVVSMIWQNRQLVTDEAVEFEK